MRVLNYRLVIFILAALFGIAFSIPSLLQTKGPKISLGLDLQGGLNLLLGVDVNEAIKVKLDSMASYIQHETKDKDILIDALQTEVDGLSFTLLDDGEKQAVGDMLRSLGAVDIEMVGGKYTITLTEKNLHDIKTAAIKQAILTIRNRIDLFGLTEPSVSRQGSEDILVQLPGIKTALQEKRTINLILKSAHLQMMAVDEDRQARVDSMSSLEARKYGDVILSDERGQKYLLKAIPIIDGDMLTDANVGYSKANIPIVNFKLDSRGAKIFGDFSGANVGKRMAVVLDNKVYSAPVIQERIGGGSGQISGSFTVEEASDLAIALRSGALPAPMKILEKRTVGPSLGADSIKSSFVAFIMGFILVLVFMMVVYHLAGIIATIALVVNIFLIIAIMAIFGATLTLPGMAGIVLIVGMSVDANIIINERIDEGIRNGLGMVKAIKQGYHHASRAIFDSNLTSLIVAVILYAYGTGAIKGFALTTSIGILASVLTAIVGTYGIYIALFPRLANNTSYRLWFGVKYGK